MDILLKLYLHFPGLKRFTYACVLHDVSHACIYVVISRKASPR